MASIYKKFVAQNWLRIRLDSELSDADMASVNAWKIKYKKPSGLAGSVVGNRDGSTSAVYYDLTASDDFINENGLWIWWLHATLSDGRVASGEAYVERIWLEGK